MDVRVQSSSAYSRSFLTSVLLAPSALDLFLQGTQLYAGSDLKDFNNLYGSAYRVVSLESSISQRIC